MEPRTQIIATIGPSSDSKETLLRMIAAGMNVARINCSHGTHESNGAAIDAIRAAAAEAQVRIPIILDLSGPREQTQDGHHFDKSQNELTEKDLDDLAFGIEKNVEYVAHSYVGCAADMIMLREELNRRNAHIPIIAKIERREALECFDEILAASDAIMVARGDLGDAVAIEEIPFIERDVIARTIPAGKPVIVATQMLLSMTQSPTPTRAEVTDVAFAVLSGADVVMLSEETALGAHPVEAVEVMRRVASRAERSILATAPHRL